MNNPYGLLSLWEQGDFIIKAVAIILLIMSILSWYVIAIKGIQLARLGKMAKAVGDGFWHTKSFSEGLALLKPSKRENQNPFRILAESASEAAAHHAQNQEDLHGALNVSDWIISCLRRSIDDATAQLQSGLSILASVGSTAPFVGLFGTVWGIYHALISIGASGQASIDKVAGPVGESLIMTALGLAVAIPAVLGYNALTRGNKSMLAQLNRFAHDLHAYFLTGGRVGKPAPQMNIKDFRRPEKDTHREITHGVHP